jgi:hypothetical protein
MKLDCYLAFVVDAQRKPHAGPLLATDRVHAMRKAIERCKAKFGPQSRVTMLKHIGEADIPLMQRTELLKVLNEFEQVAFVAVELDKLTCESLKLIQQVTAYVKTLQTKLEN